MKLISLYHIRNKITDCLLLLLKLMKCTHLTFVSQTSLQTLYTDWGRLVPTPGLVADWLLKKTTVLLKSFRNYNVAKQR
jgi:hypothetical protein